MDLLGVVYLVLGTWVIVAVITNIYIAKKNHKDIRILGAILSVFMLFIGVYIILNAFIPELRPGLITYLNNYYFK